MIEEALQGKQAQTPSLTQEYVYSKSAARGAVLACHGKSLKDRVFYISSGKISGPRDIKDAIERIIRIVTFI